MMYFYPKLINFLFSSSNVLSTCRSIVARVTSNFAFQVPVLTSAVVLSLLVSESKFHL